MYYVQMDDAEFEALVDAEAKGQAAEDEAKALRAPEVVQRWRDTLVTQMQHVNAEFTARKAAFEQSTADIMSQQLGAKQERYLIQQLQAEYDAWRRDASWFKRAIDRRLHEAKRLIAARRHTEYADLVTDERNRLRQAIIEHRDHKCTDACEPDCPADEKLWRMVP